MDKAELTDWYEDPADILRIRGHEAVADYLVHELHDLYRGQGIVVDLKHFEMIVRLMLGTLLVQDPGDTRRLPGYLVDRADFWDEYERIRAAGGSPPDGVPIVLGISEIATRETGVFATASLRRASRVLAWAALQGTVDRLSARRRA